MEESRGPKASGAWLLESTGFGIAIRSIEVLEMGKPNFLKVHTAMLKSLSDSKMAWITWCCSETVIFSALEVMSMLMASASPSGEWRRSLSRTES